MKRWRKRISGDIYWNKRTCLDLAGAFDSQLVLFGQLVHTQNGNDILQRLVVLEDLLSSSCDIIVLFADLAIISILMNDTDEDEILTIRGSSMQRLGIERVDSRVNTQFSNGTRQDGGCVQVGESGGRGRVCQIVCRDIYCLDGCNGALLRRGDTLLPEWQR